MHPEQPATYDSSSRRYGTLAADDIPARTGTSDAETETGGAADLPTVVFLHGLSFNRGHWAPVIRALSLGENVDNSSLDDSVPAHLPGSGSRPVPRMIAFDLPGHGGSPAPDSYAVPDLTARLHEAIEDAGVTAPILVGHSLGAVIATNYALRHPARGVVNIDQPLRPAGFATMLQNNAEVLRGPQYLQLWNRLLTGMHAELLAPDVRQLVVDSPPPSRELMLGYWRDLLATVPAELDETWQRQLAVLRESRIPYRYIAGDTPPPAYEKWLRDALPDVEITVLPATGHFPHLADPAGTAAVVRAAASAAPRAE
jgi:pimeloyl-ACP methyl ester carboxylesterase